MAWTRIACYKEVSLFFAWFIYPGDVSSRSLEVEQSRWLEAGTFSSGSVTLEQTEFGVVTPIQPSASAVPKPPQDSHIKQTPAHDITRPSVFRVVFYSASVLQEEKEGASNHTVHFLML